MRNAGRVVSKTMILSHVWDYSFDPRHQRRRRAGVPAAREDRQGLRAQDDPDRAGHRLCPRKWRERLAPHARASASRCGTRSIFVASSLALIGAHLLPARRLAAPVRPRDHRAARSCEYAARLPARLASAGCASEIQRTRRPRRRARCSCASWARSRRSSFFSLPDEWRRVRPLAARARLRRRRADLGTLETGPGGDVARGRVGAAAATARCSRSARAPSGATSCCSASAASCSSICRLAHRHRPGGRRDADARRRCSR